MPRRTVTTATRAAVMPTSLLLSLGCTNSSHGSSTQAPTPPPLEETARERPTSEASEERGSRGLTFVPPRYQPDEAQDAEPQLSAAQAEAQLRDLCESRCGTTIDRDALVRRLVLAGRDDEPPSSIAESARASHPAPTEAQERGLMEFARGGPGILLYRDGSIDFNPERVELDGQFGQAIFIDADDRVVACVNSDPDLLPTAVRVDCQAP